MAPRHQANDHAYDAIIIGAGFGGLGAALALAESGARVVVVETLAYPGGCASTFTRQGHRFEAGATLFSGFGEGQLMARLVARHGLDVQVDMMDPAVELRTPDLRLPVDSDRDAFVERLAALPGAPADALRGFFAWQGELADSLWSLFDDESMLPPFDTSAWIRHLRAAPRRLPLLPLLGRPLLSVLEDHGLDDFQPLTTWLDAVCRITVQAGLHEAEAPFALASMDYFWRGTGHVRGGIGVLAQALVDAIRGQGGEVLLAHRARAMERTEQGWTVQARGRRLEAPVVIANLLPHALSRLAGIEPGQSARLDRFAAGVDEGWGAVMLYLALDGDLVERPDAHHLELVLDPGAPLLEGNHVFCSVSSAAEDRGPDGARTATVSTHIAPSADQDPATRVAQVQARMQENLATLAPELWASRRFLMPASPRTFERFTGRPGGFVGGIPRRAGLRHYRDIWPAPILPGLYMVGDTVFPGQSTLAATLGGRRTAQTVLHAFDLGQAQAAGEEPLEDATAPRRTG